jgi:hypothetical protein
MAMSGYEKTLRAEAQALWDGANENLASARVVGCLELYARGGTILGDRRDHPLAWQRSYL